MPQEKEVPSLGTEERGTDLLSIYSMLDICYLCVARPHPPKFSTETTTQRGYLSQDHVPSKETPPSAFELDQPHRPGSRYSRTQTVNDKGKSPLIPTSHPIEAPHPG